MYVLSCRGPKAFQRHFAVCMICVFTYRTLAVCEIVLKLQCTSQNSFICYTNPYFAYQAKSLLSIKSRIFCLLIVVLDIGCVFIENLNLWSLTATDKHNFTLSTIDQSIEMEMPSLIVPAFVTITSSL